jgi:hypothetical protein
MQGEDMSDDSVSKLARIASALERKDYNDLKKALDSIGPCPWCGKEFKYSDGFKMNPWSIDCIHCKTNLIKIAVED